MERRRERVMERKVLRYRSGAPSLFPSLCVLRALRGEILFS